MACDFYGGPGSGLGADRLLLPDHFDSAMSADRDLETRLLCILSEHRGIANPIGMLELHARLFGEAAEHRINGTDKTRGLIRRLRRRGDAPICSTSNRFNPG